ncbi:MAG: response regulator transcription factor [Clostridia bacterium]|nr:response regulator transcription factor [Clostridia bacterium]
MIYCVEDDDGIRNMMLYTLNVSGFETQGYSNGKDFFDDLERARPELILLDVMLPGEDGITILKKLKASKATNRIPVIMATAKGTEYDKVIGLDLGADDYLAKPFGMMEMVSRVKAVLRRCAPKEREIYTLGKLTLNHSERSVKIDAESVSLTVKEYELLRLLLKNKGRVFSRDELLSEIWGSDFLGESRTVDVHVGTLRAKLGSYGDYLHTVRGFGYKIEENV